MAMVSRRVSRSAIRPRYSTSTRSTPVCSVSVVASLRQARAQRQERAQHLHVLRGHGRDVDRGRDDAAGQGRHDLLGRLDAGAVLGLGGRGAQVRRDDDVAVALEERVVRDRLAREDVERGTGDLAGVDRVLERGVVDELAAGAVDDPDAVLHLRERLGVQPAARLGRLGQVDGDEVGDGVDVGAGLGLLDAELAITLGGHERVVGDDAHPEPPRAGGHELADAAEAEDPEHLLVDLDAAELRALPLPGGQRAVRLRDVAREREHQRHRVLRGGDDVRLRRVGDDDAALGRRLDVHVVDADARAADHPQVVRLLDQVRRQLRGRADEDRVVVADALGELLVGPVDAEVDVEALAQEVDARVGELLLDEDLVLRREDADRHAAATGTPASRKTRCAAPTPEPCSTSWPSWSSTISSPESDVRMSKAPK